MDASIAIAWIADDERSPYADAALEACGKDRACVPLLWSWEVANTLLVFERKGRVADGAAKFAASLRELPITIEGDQPDAKNAIALFEIAKRHHLSVYDATYLVLAKTKSLRLATLDEELAAAARAEGCLFTPA